MSLQIEPFFDENTFSYSYVISDLDAGEAAIIDGVYDFDPVSGKLSSQSADQIINYVQAQGLTVKWILDTHVHADHLSAAQYLQGRLGGLVGIGHQVVQVQEIFACVFNAEPEFVADGTQFDRLLKEGDVLTVGAYDIKVLETPGHTPACVSYYVEADGDSAVFVGDTLFMPDYGTARTDFPGGCAKILYHSIQKLLALPNATRMYMCHDYGTSERSEYQCLTSVAEQKASNIHIGDGKSAREFAAFRQARDADLAAPRLLYPAVQFNMRAGQLPVAESNGVHYFKIPVKALSM